MCKQVFRELEQTEGKKTTRFYLQISLRYEGTFSFCSHTNTPATALHWQVTPLSFHLLLFVLSKEARKYVKYLHFFPNHKASQNKHEKALKHKIFLSTWHQVPSKNYTDCTFTEYGNNSHIFQAIFLRVCRVSSKILYNILYHWNNQLLGWTHKTCSFSLFSPSFRWYFYTISSAKPTIE